MEFAETGVLEIHVKLGTAQTYNNVALKSPLPFVNAQCGNRSIYDN